MGWDTSGLHHVGLVVRDVTAAIETYRRLGFTLPPPAYPTLPTTPGALPRPVGAANTHIHLRRNFVEIVTVIDDGQPIPADAHLIRLNVPDDKLPGLSAALRGTIANLVAFLDRFQGMHILVVDSTNLDSTAARLDAAGAGHGGVHAVQRPIETAHGTRMVPARYLEINSDDPDAPRGRLPEGRIGIAENTAVELQQHPKHANGAVDLIGCLLCVPDDALPGVERRYETYLGRAAHRNGSTRTFDLGDTSVIVVAESALPDVLPGERPPALPAFVGYTVAVHDIAQTEHHLRIAEVPHRTPRPDEIVVPASEALGVAIIFRPTIEAATGRSRSQNPAPASPGSNREPGRR